MLKTLLLTLSCYFFFSIHTSQLFAGAWTLPKGRLWVKTTLFVQRTSDRYTSEKLFCGDHLCRNGERYPYFFNGRLESTAAYLDIWYGLTGRMELQFQVPYFDIAFKDDVNPGRGKTTDFGDIKFGVRYRFLLKPLVSTLRIGAKAPTGFFTKDSEIIPIGDGQWDLEVETQFGRSWWPLPVYANVDVGYKFRFEPDIGTSNLDPGDEFTLRAEAGWHVRENLLLKFGLEGFWGKEFTDFVPNLRLQNWDRRVLYITPSVIWTVARPLQAEPFVKFSISGKNYPAGQVFGFGLSYALSINKL